MLLQSNQSVKPSWLLRDTGNLAYRLTPEYLQTKKEIEVNKFSNLLPHSKRCRICVFFGKNKLKLPRSKIFPGEKLEEHSGPHNTGLLLHDLHEHLGHAVPGLEAGRDVHEGGISALRDGHEVCAGQERELGAGKSGKAVWNWEGKFESISFYFMTDHLTNFVALKSAVDRRDL